MATDLNQMCDALEATIIAYYIAQGASVQVYSEVPGSPVSPAIIAEPGTGDYHAVLGADGGVDHMLSVHAMVHMGERAAAQRTLNDMIARTGPLSVVAAIHADRTLGGVVRYADPSGYRDYGAVSYGNATYLKATIDVTVLTL